MLSSAPRSPAARGVPGTSERVIRLEAFERWREPTKVDFEAILGKEEWERYWSLWQNIMRELEECQRDADVIQERIAEQVQRQRSAGG
jgi:hypothetical protein